MITAEYRGFGGLALAADRWGDAGAQTVLLLPGAGQLRGAWRATAEQLAAAGRHVIAPDLRGHGDSGWPADGHYELDAFVADLRALLEALPVRPVIVAASLGGWIATLTVGEGGEHLATGLVVVDAPPRMDAGRSRRAERALVERVGTEDPPSFDPRLPAALSLDALEPRLLAAAGAIRVPALVVRGEHSVVSTRAATRELAAALADCETAEVPAAGHLVATDQVDAFNALLLDFLERRFPLAPPEYREGSDPRTLRDALGCFGTGVTAVTTFDPAGEPVGLTANSFTSVSLEPPLLLVCLAKNAGSLPAFAAADSFAVNVLQIGQQPVSARFATRGADRFAGLDWERWDDGPPVIAGSLASFDCAVHDRIDAGDHVILIGRVRRVRFEPQRDPLLYFRGRYRRLHFG